MISGPTQAAIWILDYSANNNAKPAEASVTISTSDAQNAVGGFNIRNVSGQVDGDAIVGLIANPGQPFASYSADGLFIFDNVFWTSGAPSLSHPGLFFTAASGKEYNLFSDNASVYELYSARPGVGYVDHSIGTLTVQSSQLQLNGGGAVPEPAAWMLMILGFGSIGAALRRRRAVALV